MANSKKLHGGVTIMIVIFVLITALGLLLKAQLEKMGVDFYMVLGGNLLLFLLGVFALRRSLQAIDDPNPHVFVRSYYAGFLIKLAAVAVAAFFYIYSKDANVSRGSLFAFMGLYAVYTIVEVSSLRKVLKEKKNA